VDDDHGRQDHAHAQAVYDLFEHEVVPLFYDRGDDGVPHGWVARMRSSLRTLGWRFSATRMVREYADGPYRG
jgi:starch phosphorylase